MDKPQFEACSQGRGYLLTRALEARGWSRAETARRLRELSVRRRRPISTGRDGIWYWEHERGGVRGRLIYDHVGMTVCVVSSRQDRVVSPVSRRDMLSIIAQWIIVRERVGSVS